MHTNLISYTLLCENCNRREPNSTSIVESSESFFNYSRNKLISECHNILSKRECSNCGMKGRYAIWAIYCGNRPKQIHIQMTKSDGYLAVDIWDEKHNHINRKLEQLPYTDSLCQLLSRAISKLDYSLDEIIDDSQSAINASIKNGTGGNRFYIIYEEPIDFELNDSQLGEIVFTENNFNYKDIIGLMTWIQQNQIF